MMLSNMESITHERDEKGMVRIHANGSLYDYEAILSLKNDTNGIAHLPKDAINTSGIDNSILIKENILTVVQKEKGRNGEPPLVVEKT